MTLIHDFYALPIAGQNLSGLRQVLPASSISRQVIMKGPTGAHCEQLSLSRMTHGCLESVWPIVVSCTRTSVTGVRLLQRGPCDTPQRCSTHAVRSFPSDNRKQTETPTMSSNSARRRGSYLAGDPAGLTLPGNAQTACPCRSSVEGEARLFDGFRQNCC